MLIYSNQHQSLRLDILNFPGFLALPLTGESFNQCFPKEMLIYSSQHQSLRLNMLVFQSFNQCFPQETLLSELF